MKFTKITDKGGRLNNEDCIDTAVKDGICCFIAADGLGGHNSGEVASKLAADTIKSEFLKNAEVSQKAVENYLKSAQKAIENHRKKDRQSFDMATTAVVLVTDGAAAVWAHVGDSRLYRLDGGKIKEVTEDHSVAFDKFKSGIIKYADIRTSSDQNKLLATIGSRASFRPEISKLTKIGPRAAFLLCTDGFWEFVTEDDMEKAYKSSVSSEEWLDNMLQILDANKSEVNDNFSAIAIKMQLFDCL